MTERVEESLLYSFEFDFLPKFLYSEKGSYMIAALTEKKGLVFSEMIRTEELSPYSEDDFKVEILGFKRGSKKIFMIKIDMPVPENSMAPLCKQIFICFEFDELRGFYNIRYFTYECEGGDKAAKAEFFRKLNLPLPETDFCFICSVDEEGKHLNFGMAPKDPEEIIHRVYDVYCDYLGSHDEKNGKGDE